MMTMTIIVLHALHVLAVTMMIEIMTRFINFVPHAVAHHLLLGLGRDADGTEIRRDMPKLEATAMTM